MYDHHCLAVVGESGCGKSTSARIATKIHQATEGSITYQGRNIDDIVGGQELRDYRREVQMVFQDPFGSLNPLHTVRYHLERPLKIYFNITSRTELEARLIALLTQVGLTPAKEVLQKFPPPAIRRTTTTGVFGQNAGYWRQCHSAGMSPLQCWMFLFASECST